MSMGKAMLTIALSLLVTIMVVGVVKKTFNKKAEDKAAGHTIEQVAVIVENDDTTGASEVEPAFPEVDRIEELFNLGEPKLPIVKTITYTSRVDWKQGRPAWIVDYASHYNTSRHFIARSLNRKPDYNTQQIANGDKFNIFNPDKDFDFHLVIDVSRSKLLFYYYDHDEGYTYLLKTYDVGLGRPDEHKASGYLTPLGKYSLGDNVAVYRPGMKGIYNGDRIEMITTFGTRWMPLSEELGGNTEPAKGYGIHGMPWQWDEKEQKYREDRSTLGQYASDGCIRMLTEDVEELFAIIITKPTFVYLVENYRDAKLPSKELNTVREG
ncbi:MAG: L,D-transpeptidase [Chlamydiota bacterium]